MDQRRPADLIHPVSGTVVATATATAQIRGTGQPGDSGSAGSPV
jgi:hypothetical protein